MGRKRGNSKFCTGDQRLGSFRLFPFWTLEKRPQIRGNRLSESAPLGVSRTSLFGVGRLRRSLFHWAFSLRRRPCRSGSRPSCRRLSKLFCQKGIQFLVQHTSRCFVHGSGFRSSAALSRNRGRSRRGPRSMTRLPGRGAFFRFGSPDSRTVPACPAGGTLRALHVGNCGLFLGRKCLFLDRGDWLFLNRHCFLLGGSCGRILLWLLTQMEFLGGKEIRRQGRAFLFGSFLLGRLSFQQTAVPNVKRPLGVSGDLRLVGDHHDGDAFIIELLEDLHDLLTGFGIQSAGRFVGQEHFWIIHDSSGDGHTLALTAGKLSGFEVHTFAQAHPFNALRAISRRSLRRTPA